MGRLIVTCEVFCKSIHKGVELFIAQRMYWQYHCDHSMLKQYMAHHPSLRPSSSYYLISPASLWVHCMSILYVLFSSNFHNIICMATARMHRRQHWCLESICDLNRIQGHLSAKFPETPVDWYYEENAYQSRCERATHVRCVRRVVNLTLHLGSLDVLQAVIVIGTELVV